MRRKKWEDYAAHTIVMTIKAPNGHCTLVNGIAIKKNRWDEYDFQWRSHCQAIKAFMEEHSER